MNRAYNIRFLTISLSCIVQVPHILASSSSVGHTVVWDMRKTEKPVITFNTGNALVISIRILTLYNIAYSPFILVWFFMFFLQVNCHTISWHPRIATQLVQANTVESVIQEILEYFSNYNFLVLSVMSTESYCQ